MLRFSHNMIAFLCAVLLVNNPPQKLFLGNRAVQGLFHPSPGLIHLSQSCSVHALVFQPPFTFDVQGERGSVLHGSAGFVMSEISVDAQSPYWHSNFGSYVPTIRWATRKHPYRHYFCPVLFGCCAGSQWVCLSPLGVRPMMDVHVVETWFNMSVTSRDSSHDGFRMLYSLFEFIAGKIRKMHSSVSVIDINLKLVQIFVICCAPPPPPPTNKIETTNVFACAMSSYYDNKTSL